MRGYNKITLIGNVGSDPTYRAIDENRKVADFSIAVNDRSIDPTTKQPIEKTDWYRVSFWNQQAETIAQYVRKGTPIMVEGRLSVRTYTDNSGQTRFSLEVLGRDFVLLPGQRQEDGAAPAARPAAQPMSNAGRGNAAPAGYEATPDEDDLPF